MLPVGCFTFFDTVPVENEFKLQSGASGVNILSNSNIIEAILVVVVVVVVLNTFMRASITRITNETSGSASFVIHRRHVQSCSHVCPRYQLFIASVSSIVTAIEQNIGSADSAIGLLETSTFYHSTAVTPWSILLRHPWQYLAHECLTVIRS